MSHIILLTREEADAIHTSIILAHCSNFDTAAATLGIKDRVLRDMRHAHHIEWTPPCRQERWVRPMPAVVEQYWDYGRQLLAFMRNPLPPPPPPGQIIRPPNE